MVKNFMRADSYGHTTAFSKQQTKVPFVMYVPDKPYMEYTKMTSHLDVVPTLLTILGCKNNTHDYSFGADLFTHPSYSYVVASGWDKSAIIDSSNTVIFTTESYNVNSFEARDKKYAIIKDNKNLLKAFNPKILEVMKQFGEFFKK